MNLKIKFLILFVFISFGVAIYGYFNAVSKSSSENGPKIEISPKIHDFKDLNFGEVVSYDFIVKNSGDEILEIRRVSTSCLCTVAEILKKEINPGEEVILSISYDTGAMGAHGRGKQERIIYIRSNDPFNPQIEAMIYANVK